MSFRSTNGSVYFSAEIQNFEYKGGGQTCVAHSATLHRKIQFMRWSIKMSLSVLPSTGRCKLVELE